MKSVKIIGCVLAMLSCALAVSASSQIKTEKHAHESSYMQGDYIDTPVICNTYLYVACEYVKEVSSALPISMEAGVPISLSDRLAYGKAIWLPFGEINTKYHAPWLFNPLKLC